MLARRLRIYLTAVGVLLLGQGSLSLLLHEALGVDLSELHGLLTTDDAHAGLHIVWGVVLLAFTRRPVREHTVLGLGFLFGAFYVALGIFGLFDHEAFGMHLGWGQNAFHLLIGPLALILALPATREEQRLRAV